MALPAKETEPMWLHAFESQLQGITFVGKGEGCVEHTPLSGMRATIRRDGHTFAIAFGPR